MCNYNRHAALEKENEPLQYKMSTNDFKMNEAPKNGGCMKDSNRGAKSNKNISF